MSRTIREQQQYEIARKIPSDVLADAAIDQAKNFILSEATALAIAEKFQFAAELARERRVAAMKMPRQPRTHNMTIAGVGDEQFAAVDN